MVRTWIDRGVATRVRRLTAAVAVLIGAVTGTVALSSPALASVLCTPAALISAISVANATNGTVTLTSGCTYTLTAPNNTTAGGGVGLPVITGKVRSRAAGPPSPGRAPPARRRSASSTWRPRAASR